MNVLEFLSTPLIAGFLIAIIAGALGCFVVWRKMAYFGDTLAHASLLGLAFGFALEINLYLALIAACVLIAILLVELEQNAQLSTDTLLGIIAHSSLSFALVFISFIDNLRIDLMAYLFGDLLSVTALDLCWITLGASICLALLCGFWRQFIAITIDENMAKIDGYSVKKLKLLLVLMVALLIAMAMKFIGALIITSLMIIPAATAKRFATSPEQMAISAALLGCFSVFAGISFSWYQDTPTGPSVVTIASCLFFLSYLIKPTKD